MPTTSPTSPSSANSVSSTSGQNYIPGWEGAVLGLIGAPPTPANINWLSTWHSYELSAASNNPLNVTGYAPDPITVGQSSLNSAGVQIYSTPTQGIQATATFLKMSNFQPILAALQSGNAYTYSAQHSGDVSRALSTWGTPNFARIATGGAPVIGAQAGAGTGGIPAIGSAEHAVSSAGSSVASGASATANFVSGLGNPALWLRIAEVVGGALLIGLALYLIAKDLGLPTPELPGGLEKGANKVQSLEIENRERAATARSESINVREFETSVRKLSAETRQADILSSSERNRTLGEERVKRARANTSRDRARARQERLRAKLMADRAKRASEISREDIYGLKMFK